MYVTELSYKLCKEIIQLNSKNVGNPTKNIHFFQRGHTDGQQVHEDAEHQQSCKKCKSKHHLSPVRIVIIKRQTRASIVDMEKRKPSCIIDGNASQCGSYGKTVYHSKIQK